jgi:hypothetical protein
LQSFCGRAACQRKRKALWQRRKLAQDLDYRAEQKAAQEGWRKKAPGYWKRYREKHARAVERNRKKQRWRDRRRRARGLDVVRKRREGGGEGLVAGLYVMESLRLNAGGNWEVELIAASVEGEVLAKMDALNGGKALMQGGL